MRHRLKIVASFPDSWLRKPMIRAGKKHIKVHTQIILKNRIINLAVVKISWSFCVEKTKMIIRRSIFVELRRLGRLKPASMMTNAATKMRKNAEFLLNSCRKFIRIIANERNKSMKVNMKRGISV